MDFINQILGSVFYQQENHKKNDEYRGGEEGEEGVGVAIEMEENVEQNIQEFIQQTIDYFKEILGGRPLRYVDDLKIGLARTGDGINSELLWWAPVDHPVGSMLFENPQQTPPRCIIDARQNGKVAIYNDANIRLCVEEIALLLEKHRSIKLLESDQEKPPDIINPAPNPTPTPTPNTVSMKLD
jgi:hypothetical protein